MNHCFSLIRTSLIAASIFVSAPALAAEVYRCDLPNGRFGFQDLPCPSGSVQSMIRLYNSLPIAAPQTPSPITPLLTPDQVAQLEQERDTVTALMNAELEALIAVQGIPDDVRDSRIDLTRKTAFAKLQMIEEALAKPRSKETLSEPST